MVLCCFADENMTIAQDKLIESFIRYAGTEIYKYGKADYGKEFFKKNKEILEQERGCGYWLWKSYFISETLKKIKQDEWLLYCDSGIEIIHYLNPLKDFAVDNNLDILLFNNEWAHINWCKKDVLESMLPRWNNADQKQVQASVLLIKNTGKTQGFIDEWLEYCQIPHFIDDSPSEIPNINTFREHRHDQALLTNTAIKHNIPLHWWASSNNIVNKHLYNVPYPVLFDHHRRRNNEYNISKIRIGEQDFWGEAEMERIRYIYKLTSEDLVLDLGAFNGEFSKAIYDKYKCKVIAFEPTSAIDELPHTDNIQIVKAAAWIGTGKLRLGGEHFWVSMFEGERLKEYECIDINNFLHQNIALMKINIEGGEYQLLNHIFAHQLQGNIRNFQIQFHYVDGIAGEVQYEEIAKKLSQTHELTWRVPFIWENWLRK